MTEARGAPTSKPTEQRVDTGMVWRIRDSFVQYVQRMHSGRTWVDGAAAVTSAGDFYFPLVESERDEAARVTLQFAGEVGFSAHMGMLSLVLRNPRVEFEGVNGTISIERDGKWVVLGDLRLPEATRDRDVMMWATVPVVLSGEGPALFGGQYQLGEELAPLTFRVPVTEISL